MNIMSYGANVIIVADLVHARNLLNQGRVDAMYQYLSDYGYTYPKLANGLVSESSLAGQAAINNLKEVAQRNGQSLTQAQINDIKNAMAGAYLSALEANYQQGNGFYPEITDGCERAWNSRSRLATLRRILGLWNRSTYSNTSVFAASSVRYFVR